MLTKTKDTEAKVICVIYLLFYNEYYNISYFYYDIIDYVACSYSVKLCNLTISSNLKAYYRLQS